MPNPASPPSGLLGAAEPRLWTPPARRLTRRTSRGFEVADFADQVLGEPLLPWQERGAIRALELNPDGTYRFRIVLVLVARQNGKTHLSRTVALWKLYLDGAKLILGVGQDVSLAREIWTACLDTIQAVPELAAELVKVSKRNGDEWFQLANGARYKISAANRSAGRGLSVDHLGFEEIRQQDKWDAWSALSKTTQARANGQIWCISNAGDDRSIVLNHLHEAALAGADPSICLLEWSGPDGCDLDDWQAIAQANPGLGHVVSAQAIRTSMTTDPPAVYRTEVLCQRVTAINEAVDLGAWKDCADPAGTLDGLRERLVACVDVAPDGQHVTLAIAAPLDDGRARAEIAAAWDTTTTARKQLPALLDQIAPHTIVWYPGGPAAAIAPLLRPPQTRREHGRGRRPKTTTREYVELKGATVAEACQAFADAVRARRILHSDDPLANAHLAGAQKLPVGDGWRFSRAGGGHCDAAYAMAGGTYVALTMPPPKPRPKPVVLVGRQPKQHRAA